MYKRVLAKATTGSVSTYTCPPGKVGLVKAIHLANTTVNPVEVTVRFSASDGSAVNLIQSGVIPVAAALNALDSTLVMISGDALTINTPLKEGDVHCVISMMEVDQ